MARDIMKRFGGKMPKNNSNGWSFLLNIYTAPEAGMIESRLKSEGIPVLKKSKGSGAVMDIYTGQPLYGWDLYVPAEAQEKARSLLFDNIPDSSESFAYKEYLPGEDDSGPGLLSSCVRWAGGW